jgi:hypothetical protein
MDKKRQTVIIMKNMFLHRIALLTFSMLILCSFTSVAQKDLLNDIEKTDSLAGQDFVQATFKSTRNINFQTIEVLGKRTLDVRISHRFGDFESGIKSAYGVDGPANIRIGLEYSYDGRLMVGIGRTSAHKIVDGFVKYRLLRQTENNSMPISLTLITSMFITNEDDPNTALTGIDKYDNFSSRLSYVHQVIIGKKLSDAFSVQLTPVMVHYNQVDNFTDRNDMYLISVVGRMKVSKRIALTSEYAYNIRDNSKVNTYYNSLGFGIDIETGGHVFQMNITNSFGLTENQFYPYTNASWGKGGARFGFNISRVFTIG